MIPAFFLLGGLTAGLGIFLYAWKITAVVEDTLADVDAPIDYYPADHPGWRYLAEAINAERIETTPLFDQVLEESDWRAWAEEMGASHD